jgi:hypothetical protein
LNCAIIIFILKEEGGGGGKISEDILVQPAVKGLNNRLELICERLLAPNQSISVKGRYILESVVATHEVVQAAMKNKEKSLVLKLDYENDYDRLNWQFLEEMLLSRGFGNKWTQWIMRLVVVVVGGGGVLFLSS